MTKRDGQFVKVTYICQKKAKEKWVYNLEVEGLHTYYVADGELLVHNGEGVCPQGKVKIESAGESKWWHEGYVDNLTDVEMIVGVKQSEKGLSTLGSATRENAMSAGKAWVGNVHETADVKVIVNTNGKVVTVIPK